MIQHGADMNVLDFFGNKAEDYQTGKAVFDVGPKESDEKSKCLPKSPCIKSNWHEVIGKDNYSDLENGLSYALKVLGREKPEDPMERLSQLLLVYAIWKQ